MQDQFQLDGRGLAATVLICTYNRSDLLRRTLDSLSRMDEVEGGWEVLVVDNNSSDDTAATVHGMAASFPVPLRYIHEPRQGKSVALNTGIAAITSPLVAFTDDDVIVSRGWLQSVVEALRFRQDVGYAGGPVRAIWGGPRPAWLPAQNSNLWGTIAALDYGPDPFVFEQQQRIPIGANMAVRREVFDRVGCFNPALGRVGRSLLGQEQAEFFHRTRREGIPGLYVPAMELEHYVPAARLTRRYFRHWWFWKGISRARLHVLHPETELGVDLRHVPRLAGVPRFALRELATHTAGWLKGMLRRDRTAAAESEMMLMYAVGYVMESWRSRRAGGAGPVRPSGGEPRLAPGAAV